MKVIMILWIIAYNGANPALTTAEFDTIEHCEAAGKAFQNMASSEKDPNYRSAGYLCVRK